MVLVGAEALIAVLGAEVHATGDSIFAHLCEGSQLSVHEGQELLLGECAVVPFTSCIPLEDG